MVELAKAHSDLYVTISRASCVTSVSRAKFYQRLGADAIVLDPVLNRQCGRLEQVIGVLDHTQPRLLLNEGCLAQCPYQSFHWNLLAHPDTPIVSDYYLLNCTAHRLEDPSLILKSPTIRPEDLAGYQRLSNYYCLAPRSTRRSVTQSQILRAYAQGRYEGNFLDLLSNIGYPLIRNLSIPNRSLDGAWEAMWKNCMFAGNCDNCNYCCELVAGALNGTISG
jgi:collagenase-like PrtC family protease